MPAHVYAPVGIELLALRHRVEDAEERRRIGAASPPPIASSANCSPGRRRRAYPRTIARRSRQSQSRCLMRNEAVIIRTRLCMYPVVHSSRMPASTTGITGVPLSSRRRDRPSADVHPRHLVELAVQVLGRRCRGDSAAHDSRTRASRSLTRNTFAPIGAGLGLGRLQRRRGSCAARSRRSAGAATGVDVALRGELVALLGVIREVVASGNRFRSRAARAQLRQASRCRPSPFAQSGFAGSRSRAFESDARRDPWPKGRARPSNARGPGQADLRDRLHERALPSSRACRPHSSRLTWSRFPRARERDGR